MRTASLGVAYGLWVLGRWLFEAKPVATPLGVVLLALTIVVGVFFLFLGTAAPRKVVATVWRILGKGVFYILLFS